MLNTHDLEKRWLQYKIKSYLPHVIIVLSLIIIIVIAFNFLPLEKTAVINMNIDKQTALQIHKPIIQKEIIKTVQTSKGIVTQKTQILTLVPVYNPHKNSKVQLSPSLDFMKDIQHSSHLYYNTHEVQTSAIQEKHDTKPQVVPIEEEIKDVIVKEPIKKVLKKKIKIKRQNTQNDIFKIIKRFKKNNNPALSLFVAKKSYELHNYAQAYNYALITNGIDDNIEASWLIFAKSLYKLNKKDKAIKTLKQYINYSHSTSAKLLLNEMKEGTFQ